MTIDEMNQALQVLVNAINIAQKRGTYSLEESAAIYAAIQSFTKKEDDGADSGSLEDHQLNWNKEDDADETPTQLEET